MNSSVIANYIKERKPHVSIFATANSRVYQIPARTALHNVKTREAWRKAEWDEHSEPEIGEVRLRIEPDDSGMSFEDLTGDTYNPKVNPDIPKARMDRERQAETVPDALDWMFNTTDYLGTIGQQA
jgi:hypothetical protein